MPLYELKCGSCGHRFERIVKFSDPPVKSCPHCGKDAVEQVISAPAVQFKGSGWYVSDYARKKTPASSAASESGEKVSSEKEASVKEGTPKEGATNPSAPDSGAKPEKASGSSSASSASDGSSPKPDAGKK
jgi:putative FmdB family regulatory protein